MSSEPSTGGGAVADRALIRRYLGGDERAAEVFYGRHRGGLLHYLLRRLRRQHLAEEALQETFLRFFARSRALLFHPRPGAWLRSVARNVSADICRRRRLEAAPFSDCAPASVEARLSSPEARPEAWLQSRELSSTLMEIVRSLPPREREVFFLRTQAGLSFRQIAARLGAPLNTVLGRMHRAMMRIRTGMAAREER